MGDMAELAESYALDEWDDWGTLDGVNKPALGGSLEGIVRKIVREELDKRFPVITWPSMPVPYYPPPAYPPTYPTYPTREWASPLTFGGGAATTTAATARTTTTRPCHHTGICDCK